MQELASLAILAEALLVELRADLSLVVARQVSLLLKLVARVSKRAAVTVMAGSKLLHVAAHLSLSHLDDFLVEHLTLLLGLEVSLALVRAGSVNSSARHLHEVLVATVDLNDGRAHMALEQRCVRHVVLETGFILTRADVGGSLRAIIIMVAAEATMAVMMMVVVTLQIIVSILRMSSGGERAL